MQRIIFIRGQTWCRTSKPFNCIKLLVRMLLKDGRSMNLKDNIVEHFDFEAVSPCVWKYIYSWYSADWCIMRTLKRDKMTTNGVFLDLYPELSIPGQVILDHQTDEDPSINASSTLNKMKSNEIQENEGPSGGFKHFENNYFS